MSPSEKFKFLLEQADTCKLLAERAACKADALEASGIDASFHIADFASFTKQAEAYIKYAYTIMEVTNETA